MIYRKIFSDKYKRSTPLLVESDKNLGINKIPLLDQFLSECLGGKIWHFPLLKICLHAKNQPCLAPFCPIWPCLGSVWFGLVLLDPAWPFLTTFQFHFQGTFCGYLGWGWVIQVLSHLWRVLGPQKVQNPVRDFRDLRLSELESLRALPTKTLTEGFRVSIFRLG